MADKIKNFYKDSVVPVASFSIKPTMDKPGQPQDNANSGVSGKVTPKELPNMGDSLFHGPKS